MLSMPDAQPLPLVPDYESAKPEPKPETVHLAPPESKIQETVPAPDRNPHGRVTGEVTMNEQGKIVQASYPQDGGHTHK